jgi:hypothetical protein
VHPIQEWIALPVTLTMVQVVGEPRIDCTEEGEVLYLRGQDFFTNLNTEMGYVTIIWRLNSLDVPSTIAELPLPDVDRWWWFRCGSM